MVSIDAALSRIKDDWRAVLAESHIEAVCRDAGLKWRKRVLDPVTTILIFFLQILHRNTAITGLPRMAGIRFTPGAYCQARRRLPLPALRRLLHETGAPLRTAVSESPHTTPALWRGHRIFLLDASSCSMPDTPSLQKRFGQPGGQTKGCGFPVAHLLMLVDAHSGLILDVLISPLRTHDLRRAAELHAHLRPGDITVADRAYCSYGHVAALRQQGVLVVFRVHQKLRLDRLRPFASAAAGRPQPQPTIELLGGDSRDQLVLWNKPKYSSHTMDPHSYAALPACLIARIVRYTIERPGYRTRCVTLLSTLLDAQSYPAEALAELYGLRWQIEINFRHLKQTLGLDVLHCKTPDGVEKEIVMFTLVYNLVRAVMLAEAGRRRVPPDRISFVDALRHLSWPLLQNADFPLVINPLRPGRVEPRVRKRRPKQYPLMQEPRETLRKRLLDENRAA